MGLDEPLTLRALGRRRNLSFTTVSSLDPIQDLESLFTKIRAICKDQFAVIHSVFPAAACNSTRELLIERLFNDPAFGIFSYLDQFLNARRQSSATANQLSETPSADDAALEYVRLLCAAYEKTCDLALAIEAMEVAPTVTSLPAKTATSFASPESEPSQDNPADDDNNNSSDSEALSPDQARMQTFLSLQLHSLFGGHRQRYFRTELDLVQSQFQRAVAGVKFPQPPTPKQKATATKAKHTSASAHAGTTANTPSGASSSSFERDGLVAASTPESALVFYDSLLAIADDDSVPELYHAALRDAVGRCEFILKDSDLRPELVTKLFASYVASFGDEYLGVRMRTGMHGCWLWRLVCVCLTVPMMSLSLFVCGR